MFCWIFKNKSHTFAYKLCTNNTLYYQSSAILPSKVLDYLCAFESFGKIWLLISESLQCFRINWRSEIIWKSQVEAFGDGEGESCSQRAERRWRKTEQRSQRSAGGDSGSVGRPQRHVLSGFGMTAQVQLVLDARAATGRSVQVIKPFMHSSSHPQALCASSLGNVTTVYHCFCWTPLIALILLPPLCFHPSFPESFFPVLKYAAFNFLQ